jgi:hypothetical protein
MITYLYDINIVRPFNFPGFTGPSPDFVQGTIITDCNNCALAASDFVGWDLSLNIHGASPTTLTAGNSTLTLNADSLFVATPLGLFTSSGAFLIDKGVFLDYSAIFVSPNSTYWTLSGAEVITVLPTDLLRTYSILGTPVPAVPEPSTAILMALGIAGLFLTRLSQTSGHRAR